MKLLKNPPDIIFVPPLRIFIRFGRIQKAFKTPLRITLVALLSPRVLKYQIDLIIILLLFYWIISHMIYVTLLTTLLLLLY